MKTIIKTELTDLEAIQVCDLMGDMLYESISCVADKPDDFNWYEDCSFEDYFEELQPIYDEKDNYEGEGLNLIPFSVVITDENRQQMYDCFENARDTTYKYYKEEILNDKENGKD